MVVTFGADKMGQQSFDNEMQREIIDFNQFYPLQSPVSAKEANATFHSPLFMNILLFSQEKSLSGNIIFGIIDLLNQMVNDHI
jgi:hypothetical protein